MLDMATDPYEIKVLCEIQQICKELGIASNEVKTKGGYFILIDRYKNGLVKHEAHIQCFQDRMYNVYFSAFHDKPFKIGVLIGYDVNGYPFVAETFD